MKHHLKLFVLLIVGLMHGCGKPVQSTETPANIPATLSLVSADLLQITPGDLSRGPMISGSLQPVIKAELNAEVSGIVTQVLKDNGDLVKAGELLVQLDQTTYRDKLLSAQEAERSAAVALEQANRQLKRMQSLSKQSLVTQEGLEAAYARGESDEFVKATTIGEPVKVEDGDAVVFMNFRADRARQLTSAFVAPGFEGFSRRLPKLGRFVCLTEYDARLPAPVALPQLWHRPRLSQCCSCHHIARFFFR